MRYRIRIYEKQQDVHQTIKSAIGVLLQKGIMKSLHLLLLSILAICVFPSCNDCNKVYCQINVAHFRFKLLKNGEDVVFGPNPLIDRDSIRAYALSIPQTERFVGRSDSLQFLSLYLGSAPIVLELNGMPRDTFSYTSAVVDVGECCPVYEVRSITRNGEVICTGLCEEIIELEI